jgi:hypothetical protein
MFALIIAIIAIALTVYLAVSTLFYGGDALSNGSARAIASAFINQGQQINGAHTLYKNDNAGSVVDGTTVTLSKLVTDNYLSSLPKPSAGGAWTVANLLDTNGPLLANGLNINAISSVGTGTTLIADEVCTIIKTQAGVDNATFGCFATDLIPVAGQNTVWYRM